MNKRLLVWGSVVSAVVMWLVAGFFHEVVFRQFFADNATAEHEGTFIILVAYFILALLMTYIYLRIPWDSYSIKEGIKFGAMIGVLWVFPHGLAMAAAHGESITYEVINGAWHLVEQGIGGAVISYLCSRQLAKE